LQHLDHADLLRSVGVCLGRRLLLDIARRSAPSAARANTSGWNLNEWWLRDFSTNNICCFDDIADQSQEAKCHRLPRSQPRPKAPDEMTAQRDALFVAHQNECCRSLRRNSIPDRWNGYVPRPFEWAVCPFHRGHRVAALGAGRRGEREARLEAGRVRIGVCRTPHWARLGRRRCARLREAPACSPPGALHRINTQ